MIAWIPSRGETKADAVNYVGFTHYRHVAVQHFKARWQPGDSTAATVHVVREEFDGKAFDVDVEVIPRPDFEAVDSREVPP